jgi:hypothetical protein
MVIIARSSLAASGVGLRPQCSPPPASAATPSGLKPDVVVWGEQCPAEDGQRHRARCNEQRKDHGCFLSSLCRADIARLTEREAPTALGGQLLTSSQPALLHV